MEVNSEYSFTIVADNEYGSSEPSDANDLSTSVPAAIPSQPTVQTTTNTDITITWARSASDPSDDGIAVTYKVGVGVASMGNFTIYNAGVSLNVLMCILSLMCVDIYFISCNWVISINYVYVLCCSQECVW